jgi:hypothetical protein
MKNKGILLSIIALSLLLLGGILSVVANPTVPEPLKIDKAGGGPYFDQEIPVRFVSENVTVTLDENDALVEANYTFQCTIDGSNSTVNTNENGSIEQIILLPFYEKPWNIDLTVDSEPLDFRWESFHLSDYGLVYYTYESYEYHGLIALNFTLCMEPNETCIVEISYYRDYMISSEKVVRRNFIYLARTGSLWKDPIEYARFRFLVDEDMVKDGFESVPDFNGYAIFSMSIEDIHKLVDFLDEEVSREDGYILLERTYTKWVPETDVGVAWDLHRPVNMFKDSMDIYKDRIEITFNGSLSYDMDGFIVNYTWNYNGDTYYGEEYTIEMMKFGFFHIALETLDDSGLKSIQQWDYLILPEDEMFTLNLTELLQGWGMIGFYNIRWNIDSLHDVKWEMDDGTILEGKNVKIYTGKGGRSEIDVFHGRNDWNQQMLTIEVLTTDADLEVRERDQVKDEWSCSTPFVIGVGGSVFILLLILIFVTILIIRRRTFLVKTRGPRSE